MASLITVRLDKGPSASLGFRLQGGKDFGTPLVIQKVNGGSPAERAGLIAGDSVIKINTTDVFNLRHKDAQDVIVRAGPSFEITVQRGGSTWKPAVAPVGSFASSPSVQNVSPVTKTSLASTRKENIGAIGTGHNVAAKPFSPQLNGTVNGGGPKVVNNQYNSPLKLYSEESIAETLSAQTEVLSTGALGVNFKKNEKNYDATNSAVFRMLQEAEKEPKTPEAEPDSGVVTAPLGIAGLRHVAAPENRSVPSTPQLPPGQNICADCERLIVGVFVRIKDKNLHVECFKCSTCGTSLKNVGYYNINNKLYCDVHAKLAARNNPPTPNLVPVTVPPGGKAPVNAISAALASHSLPSPSPLSPKSNLAQPFQQPLDELPPLQNLSVTNESNNNKYNNDLLNTTPKSFNKFLSRTGSYSAPKPFSSVSAPISSPPTYNTLPKAAPALAPLSPIVSAPAPTFSPSSQAGRSVNIVWPPPQEEPEVPTACPLYFPPPSQVVVKPLQPKIDDIEDSFENYELEEIEKMAMFQTPKMSMCSEEVCEITGRKSAFECVETISETLQTQQLIENVLKNQPRPQSPPPLDKDVIPLTKDENLQKGAKVIKEQGLKQESHFEERHESCELKRLTEYVPNTIECQFKTQVENTVPKQWESSMVQALKTLPDQAEDKFVQIPSKFSSSALASALATAPSEPFSLPPRITEPICLPEETEPYFPPEYPLFIETTPETKAKPEKPDSELVSALRTAPDRPFTPVGGPPPPRKKKDPLAEYFKDLPKPEKKLSMRDALTVASDRPFTPTILESCSLLPQNEVQPSPSSNSKKENEQQRISKPFKAKVVRDTIPIAEQKPPQPPSYPWRLQEKEEMKSDISEEQRQIEIKTTIEKQEQVTVPDVQFEPEPQTCGMFPLFKGFTCSFDTKTDHSQFSVEISTTPPVPNFDRITPVMKPKETTMTTTIVKEESKSELVKQEKKAEKKETIIEKQAEDVILKKPLPLAASLHKPETLPQYQKNISDNAEAELLLMRKRQEAELRIQQQKLSEQVQVNQPVTKQNLEVLKKPVITIEQGTSEIDQTFQPVREDRPLSSTFSSRPGSITPSLINKPPAVIPYYQANLVAQECSAPSVHLLDPKSPAISRSPSPCPDVKRSLSPFKSDDNIRPKSPAEGPPPNPLKVNRPLPTPSDSRKEVAKQNVSQFIPQHQSRTCYASEQYQISDKDIHSHQSDQLVSKQMASNLVNPQTNICGTICGSGDVCKKSTAYTCGDEKSSLVCPMKDIKTPQPSLPARNIAIPGNVSQGTCAFRQTQQVEDIASAQKFTKKTLNQNISVAIAQQSHLEHQEKLKKTQTRDIQQHGGVQIDRKRTVTEEFEQTHKSNMIEIDKNVTTTKSYPFRNVKGVALEEQGVIGLHVTNPQRISSPFLKSTDSPTVNIQTQQNIKCASGKASEISLSQSESTPLQPPSLLPEASKLITHVKHVPCPAEIAPIRHVSAPSGSKQKPSVNKPNIPVPNAGSGGGRQAGAIGVAPKRGRGVLNTAALGGTRVPLCGQCHNQIRGPFITALGKIWCPEHFICATPSCRRPLQDLGFVEERGQLYCEYCFEQYLAPPCSKCNAKIKGDCLKAIGKNFHPECFNCAYCGKLFGNSPFFLEDGSPYCEADWNELFTTKCYACGFPVEAGDRWVEALNNNYHSQCFNCTMCKKNLEGQSFFAKGGRPFCKNHAR